MSVEQAFRLHEQGRLSEASSLYQAALKRDREEFNALLGLGTLRSQQGRFDEARGLLRRAVRQKPQSAEAHYNLGIVLKALKLFDEAAQHYQTALAVQPGFFAAHNNLGNVLQQMDRHEDAMVQYRLALAIKPASAAAHNNLGNSLNEVGRWDEAEMSYRRAIALQPDYAEAYHNLGNVLRLLGRGVEALPCYELALALSPGYVAAHYNFGNALKELGRFDEAAAALRKAIALDPSEANADSYLNLVEFQKIKADAPELAAMEALVAAKQGLAGAKRLPLHFALGRVYGELGRHDDAFRHLAEGGALKRRELAYDEAAMHAYFARIKQVFTPELMREKAGSGDPSPTPLFILGMPRSGTTLVEQILASHPKVFGAGELSDLSKLAKTMPYPEGLQAASAEQLRKLGASYVGRIRARGGDAPWISDKMPANFFYVGFIRLALPNARIIHTRRNPVDTCLSCFSQLFLGSGQNFSYDLGELGRYWRQYDALMAHWRQILPEGAMLEIDYADVVADTETQARRILAFCGIEWDDACLAFHQTERPVLTASVAQVRQPIYQSAVGKWRAYERHLAPLLKELTPDQVLG
jgi:tetratricopeptide (TPR) repeat protein